MSLRACAPALLIAALAGEAAWGQAPRARSADLYVVDRVRVLISADEIVGSKRAGLMCLSNGTIRWGDVSLGANLDQREIVQDVLEDAGLRTASLGALAPARRQIRIRGVIKAAGFRLCARNWGLGERNGLSGDARLEVEWRAEDGDGGDPGLTYVSTIERRIYRGRAASLGSLYRLLLEDAARDLAAWLSATKQPPS